MHNWKIEDIYGKIFNSTVAAIGIIDLEGKYQIVNPAWTELLGYSPTEARLLHVNDVTPQEDRESSSANLSRLTSGELPGLRLTRRYLHKNGSTFWADLHVSPLTDAMGKVVALVGVFVDIGRQIQAEENLQKLNTQLTLANIELQSAMEDLNRLARRDPLTQLYNRRVLDEIMEREVSRAARGKQGLAVAIADLDNFKNINDTHGHEVGDIALIELARVVLEEIRTTDYVGRWGGEEFLFVFPDTSCKGALIVIERVRKKVEKLRIPAGVGFVSLTISIGLSFHDKSYDHKMIIEEADRAMYLAKEKGKNRCEYFQRTCG